MQNKNNYICNICNKKFKRLYDLKRHLLIHSDKKLFFCNKCKYGCNRRYNLKKHTLKCKIISYPNPESESEFDLIKYNNDNSNILDLFHYPINEFAKYQNQNLI